MDEIDHPKWFLECICLRIYEYYMQILNYLCWRWYFVKTDNLDSNKLCMGSILVLQWKNLSLSDSWQLSASLKNIITALVKPLMSSSETILVSQEDKPIMLLSDKVLLKMLSTKLLIMLELQQLFNKDQSIVCLHNFLLLHKSID